MKAQAIRIHETGGPEVLRVEEVDVPRPGKGEVRLEQTAIGVNFTDTYNRTGLYKQPLPIVLGHEAAGIVEAVGEDVQGLKKGDRVAYAGGPIGAYASARLYPAERLVPLPDWIDDQTAASLMLKGMTAEYLLRRTFPVQKGDWIVVHAAAGATGGIMCQWGKFLGAHVIGTVGSGHKIPIAEANGAEKVVVTDEPNWPAKVRDFTDGAGVCVVYDGVGKDTFDGSLECLMTRGLMVSFGNASGPVPPVAISKLNDRGSLFLTRPKLWDYVAARKDLMETAAALFDVVHREAVKATVAKTFSLAEAADAHRAIESRAITGSIILLP
ncbi:MAG: NADPH:quinone reductase and related Zn-dependent oxidoreductase [Rhodospirillales bacterium]|nr:NADPH:quinone reductase and related Zn-dependent oxidoreductase [Rhodospirillales bacterium]